MKQCYFCGNTDNKIEVNRIKYEGKKDGKRKQKTVNVCITCDAMSDDKWCREKFGWDYCTYALYSK